jgi:hypothetical protein
MAEVEEKRNSQYLLEDNYVLLKRKLENILLQQTKEQREIESLFE